MKLPLDNYKGIIVHVDGPSIVNPHFLSGKCGMDDVMKIATEVPMFKNMGC